MTKEYLFLTGASSGIGRQCAIQLSQYYNLVLCARRIEKLKETKSLCQNPDNHLIFECDLSEISSLEEKLNNFLINNDIVIDKFLHCAGTLNLIGAKGFDLDICQRIYNTNVFSAMMIVKVLLKKNNKKALKNIVFISSLNSIKADKGNSLYTSSKAALDGYMRSMAKELAPKIRVNSILPGAIIDTAICAATTQEFINEIEKEYPLGFGKVQDIANAAEFLFSDKSSWITGQKISVDGGASI